jgi:hypothetical protein
VFGWVWPVRSNVILFIWFVVLIKYLLRYLGDSGVVVSDPPRWREIPVKSQRAYVTERTREPATSNRSPPSWKGVLWCIKTDGARFIAKVSLSGRGKQRGQLQATVSTSELLCCCWARNLKNKLSSCSPSSHIILATTLWPAFGSQTDPKSFIFT